MLFNLSSLTAIIWISKISRYLLSFLRDHSNFNDILPTQIIQYGICKCSDAIYNVNILRLFQALNPQLPVPQKIADEVVFRRFQG